MDTEEGNGEELQGAVKNLNASPSSEGERVRNGLWIKGHLS